MMSYTDLIGFGLIVGCAVFASEVRRREANSRRFLLALSVVAGAALLGGKVWAFVELGGIGGSGLRYPGALIGIGLALLLMRLPRFGISVPVFADVLAVAMPFGFATIRVACLTQGCCFGHLCELPWAVTFGKGTTAWQVHRLQGLIEPNAAFSLSVHPLQVYFGLWCLVVGFFLLWFRSRQSYPGQLALLYLALHEPGKWLLEFLRYQYVPAVQAVSGVVGAVAVLALVVISFRRNAPGVNRLAIG